MHRLVVVIVALAGCRMNFDPIEETSDDDDMIMIGGMTSTLVTAPPGSDFAMTCMADEPCTVDCSASASCVVDCNGAPLCDVACNSQSCIVQACIAPTCTVDCGDGQLGSFGTSSFCAGG